MANYWLDERHDVAEGLKKHFSSFVGRLLTDTPESLKEIDIHYNLFWANHKKWQVYQDDFVLYLTVGSATNGMAITGLAFQARAYSITSSITL